MISGGGRISEKKYPTNRIGTTTTTTTKVRCMFTPQNFKKNNLAKTNPPPLKIKWTTLGTEIAKSRLVVVTLKEKQKPRKQELTLSRTLSLMQVYNTVVIYTPWHICISVHINTLQCNYWPVTVPFSIKGHMLVDISRAYFTDKPHLWTKFFAFSFFHSAWEFFFNWSTLVSWWYNVPVWREHA